MSHRNINDELDVVKTKLLELHQESIFVRVMLVGISLVLIGITYMLASLGVFS